MRKSLKTISTLVLLVVMLCSSLFHASAASKSVVINFSLNSKDEAELQAYIKERFPGCKLKINNNVFGNAIVDMVLTKGHDADVLLVSSQAGLLQSLIKKDFYHDLGSIPGVKEKVNSLYPQLQDLVHKEGEIAAYPLHIELGPLMSWDAILANKLGLPDKAPENMLEIIHLMRQHPEIELDWKIYTIMYDGGENPLLQPFAQHYDLHMLREQGQLAYNTPTFRETVKEVLALSQQVDAEHGGWFVLGFNPSTSASTLLSFNPRSTATYHVVSLNQESKPVIGLEASCLMINPFTKNREAAEAVLSFMISRQDPVDLMGMSPDAQQPLQNPNYEKEIESINARIDKVQAYIDSPKTSLEDREVFKLQLADNLAKKEHIEAAGAFLVSADSIAWYREQVAPFFYLRGNTAFETDTWLRNQSSLFYQVMGGAIGLEEFITQLDQQSHMIALEAGDD